MMRLFWLVSSFTLSLLLLLLPYQQRNIDRLEVGSEAAASALSGFSFIEQAPSGLAYRWSEAQATLHFAMAANRPYSLRLLLHALRPATPPAVTVTVNQKALASFEAGGSFAEYQVTLGRSSVGLSGDLLVGLQAEPFQLPPDPRQLGVAVAWVELTPAGGLAIPTLPEVRMVVLPWLLIILALALAGWQSRSSLTLTCAALILGGAAGALLRWQWPPATQHYSWQWALGAAGVIVIGLWGKPLAARLAAAGRELWRKHPLTVGVALITLGGLLIYLPLARTTGYWGDIEIYMAWTHQITHKGIHTAYAYDAVTRPNTTPGLFYPFWVAGQLFQRFVSPDFPPPWIDRTDQDYLRFFLRLPALLCTALSAWVIYRVVASRLPKSEDFGGRQALGLLAAASLVFNPAILFEAAYYGQTGMVHAFFMLLGVVALINRRPAWGWAALAVGMLTKPQADIFLPLFVILTWQRYGWRALLRSFLAAGAVAVVMLSPFLIYGTIGEMWERISRTTEYHPFLSATAHNIWWLLSLGNGKSSDLLLPPLLDQLGWRIFSYRFIGLGLVGLAYLLVINRSLRDRSPRMAYRAFAYLFTAFFMLATQIHENHLIPMFPLLLLVAIDEQRYWRLYWLFALAATLNMALHYPQFLQVWVPHNPDVWGGAEMALPRWLSSLFQVGLFVWWTILFVREPSAAASRSPAARPAD